jgi:thymidylate kinase
MLAHACPAPDLVLLLDAPGDVMFARKGEFSPEHLEAERQQFLQMRQRVPQLQVVDVTRAPEAVRADVVERIWRGYAARLGK